MSTQPSNPGAFDRPAQPEIRVFSPGPYQTNCYLVSLPGVNECWLIDLGLSPERELEQVAAAGLEPSRLLLTHAHVDHMAGVEAFRRRFPGRPVCLHGAERGFLGDPGLNLSVYIPPPVSAGEADEWLTDGQELSLAGTAWRVIHVPGHSPGGVGFWCESAGVVISGDALFAGSVGRTDFPNSDQGLLFSSIRQKLYALPGETRVLPGHGPETTIGKERTSNPFVRG
ncbi:MAG: MBL fold metallo-hydrolase [Phycisphaerales bacterium]